MELYSRSTTCLLLSMKLLGFSVLSYASELQLPVAKTYQSLASPNFNPLLAINSPSELTSWMYSQNISYPNDYIAGWLNKSICDNTLCVAVGQYLNNNDSWVTWVMGSTDNGHTWSNVTQSQNNISKLTDPPPFPAPANFGNVYDVSCNGSTCILAGYNYSSNNYLPSIAQLNNLNHWSYVNINLPNDITSASQPFNYINTFVSTYCDNAVCMAAGSYKNKSQHIIPLLVQKVNNQWNYVSSISQLDPSGNSFITGELDNIVCSGATCVSVGYYINSSDVTLPLVAYSANGGQNWSYTLTQPSDFQNFGYINGSSCSTSNCIMAGSYLNTNGDTLPLLAYSTNSGQSWVYLSVLPSDFKAAGTGGSGAFSEVNCNGVYCVVVGSYLNASGKTVPMLVQNPNIHSNITNWTYVTSVSNISLPDFQDFGTLESVNCNSTGCVASGSYTSTNDNKAMPLFAQTIDFINWLYLDSLSTIVSQGGSLPPDFDRLIQQGL